MAANTFQRARINLASPGDLMICSKAYNDYYWGFSCTCLVADNLLVKKAKQDE